MTDNRRLKIQAKQLLLTVFAKKQLLLFSRSIPLRRFGFASAISRRAGSNMPRFSGIKNSAAVDFYASWRYFCEPSRPFTRSVKPSLSELARRTGDKAEK